MEGLLEVTEIPTTPFDGQKPGTSGLRKKTTVFQQPKYLANFVQSIFAVLPPAEVSGSTIVVSGDGRYWTQDAVQIIVKIAAAHGVARVWVGKDAIMSTPAVSAVIRTRERGIAYGGIVLTASHNPGGPHEDFGIKYNVSNGGPAPEALTDAIYAATRTVHTIRSCERLPSIDLSKLGRHEFGGFVVEVIDPVEDYAALLATIFDFPALRAFVARPDFSMLYDALSGVAGAYATRILSDMLGVPASALRNCTPLPDFGGHHPDPNLTYASELVAGMGLTANGSPAPQTSESASVPDFGAAQDGDADRNMVLGRRFFVTPSDSVAVIAAQADAIPFFKGAGGLKSVARSMPTSAALDRVAARRGLRMFEVPTGWKFFGNLMDSAVLGGEDFNPFLCGEESFGTGSNHVREKDGLWAVLAWLSILAAANVRTPVGALVSVESIVRAHWAEYGRNFYCRYDYEGVDAVAADALIAHLRERIAVFTAARAAGHPAELSGGYAVATADEFRYVDPVDGSVSDKQGLRFIMIDGSRVVYRLSGTGSVGATIRIYIEKYEPDIAKHSAATADALAPLVHIAVDELGQVAHFTGRAAPTVIT